MEMLCVPLGPGSLSLPRSVSSGETTGSRLLHVNDGRGEAGVAARSRRCSPEDALASAVPLESGTKGKIAPRDYVLSAYSTVWADYGRELSKPP